MELMLGALMGLLVGGAATRSHPRVNPGLAVGALIGLLAGMLGRAWFGPSLTSVLADHVLAGAIAGGALGGVIFAPLMGMGAKALGRYWANRPANRPVIDD